MNLAVNKQERAQNMSAMAILVRTLLSAKGKFEKHRAQTHAEGF